MAKILSLQITRLIGIILIFSIISSAEDVSETPKRNKCPEITECPFKPELCSEDDDCNPDSNCCQSPCGKICAKQISTGCHLLRKATARRAKSLGVDVKNVRTPRCRETGSFETIQCDNEIVSSCWCVNEQGFELAGTRAPAASLVNCTEPKPCASHTCRMFCPYGFSLDIDGCPLCRCRDPCDNIRCPNSLDCQLEELACLDPPCPPIPTCKRGRSLNNICPVGEPLRITDTVRPFLCGNEPSKPSCPPLYRCLVQPGNDYGVCCPASLKLQKDGSCPNTEEESEECGSLCTHDLECSSIQKCCNTRQCGSSCIHPKNVTECYHQKALSELLAVSERVGRGYVPQCTGEGEFEAKQCSRNGLVCWCVNKKGSKIKGSMGPAETINCSLIEYRDPTSGRSIDRTDDCEKMECAAVCEYGFKLDDNGCDTCKCDDPCEGYSCPEDEECVAVRDASCTDFLCPTLPVCRPKTVYVNPCKQGAPLTDDISGTPIACSLRTDEEGTMCPMHFECTAVAGSTQSVCCPIVGVDNDQEPSDNTENEARADYEKPQTMCEYLRSFTENMEGTREGMVLAIPQPTCDAEGNYAATQCHKDECWCVDQFGTEMLNTRVKGAPKNCTELRSSIDCLDLTCRMGCDYGFILEQETGCPSCQCRDPCQSIKCNNDQQCQMVEVSCKDHYCPPVPACLPKKTGQCPYLVPPVTTSCDFECNSDLTCNGTDRCCSNGCGTQCTEPLLLTACQHQKALAEYQAHESGIPAGRVYVPHCKEDGSYNSLQCHPGNQECWCVDLNGFEISQTRNTSDKQPDCESKSFSGNCPLYNCVNNCEHGYQLDKNGCRTCNCVDPCASLVCREDGESCRLVHVECIDWPCPSVPMCLPKKENPCQNGEPYKLAGSNEIVTCGPDYETCPSSHKCQLSPLGEYAVCCPKPRDVCFESLEQGYCSNSEDTRNLTRFYFNSKTNKCERFIYLGCQGNHNNFHTEDMCNIVCPVLSQCERLREKNKRASEHYKKPTFTPRCEKATGNWEPVQCMEYVGVCWCVNPQGEHLKGTLTRGKEPQCNFRQARGRGMDNAESVLEDVMVQLASLNYYEPLDNSINQWDLPLQSRCEMLGAQCDQQGRFHPTQCDQDQCWCVDDAGNQLPHTSTFKNGEHICFPIQVEHVEVTIGLRGEYNDVSLLSVANNLRKVIKQLHGTIKSDRVVTELTPDALYLKLSLVGNNKVDVAYKLEQMVTQQQLPDMTADITRSRFIHQLSAQHPVPERIVTFQHREIVSQSPVSMLASYHTAFIVVAAASAFVICVLTLLVVLYRFKMVRLSQTANKVIDSPQRFLPSSRPIYIELPNEQLTPPSVRQDKVQESADKSTE